MTQSDLARSPLWAVTCYFNPLGWRSRLRNYRCFRRHLGVPLLTVEWHPAGRYELGPGDADVLIQVQGGDLMWQKERLLNLGIGQLPAQVEHVAWLDCEVLFCDPGWPRQAAAELEKHAAIQPFSQVWYLGPEQTRQLVDSPAAPGPEWPGYRVGGSVIASAHLLHQEGREALVDADLRGHLEPDLPNDGSRLPRIPGLAWAARRSAIADLGLFDRAIIGSGDWLWMLGILGSSQRWLATASELGYSYLAHSSYPRWAEAAHERVGGSIGYVDAPVLHLYHGPLGNRRYKTRHRSFSQLQIDIEKDIQKTEEGVWKLVDPRPEWTAFMDQYFRERNEDEALVPDPDLVASASDERRVRDLLAGAQVWPALLVAHQLRLFPLLAGQERDLSEICEALHLKRRPAEALLAICVAAGLVRGHGGRYALLPYAEQFFLSRSPVSFGGYLDLMIEASRLYTFECIQQAILTDTPQAGRVLGAGRGPEAEAHRDRILLEAMQSRGASGSAIWPGLLDLSGHRVLLDLGGGSGVHSIGALRRWPHLQAIVFDLEPVCKLASERIAAQGLADRIRAQAGDFWDPSPFPAADVHLYSEVFHNRSPEACRQLLAKSFRDLTPGGRILLLEMMFDEGLAGPLPVAAANLNMLLWTREGRQYSGPQLSGMLSEAGFLEVRIVPAGGYFSLASARKPQAVSPGASGQGAP